MSKIKTALLLVGIFGLSLFAHSPVYAAPSCNANSGGAQNGGDCADETAFKYNNKNKEVSINDLVSEVLKFMSAIVGIAVVGGIVYGGILYSTSEGNPGQAQKGVTAITNSIIGLLLFIFMYAIINFLIPGGVLR